MPIDTLQTEQTEDDRLHRSSASPDGGVFSLVQGWLVSEERGGLHAAYERARVAGSLLAAVSMAGMALALSWIPGALVAVLAAGVTVHASIMRRRQDASPFPSLLLDVTVLAVGVLVVRPPFLILLPPLAYVIVAAPLLLEGYRAALVVTYAITGSAAVLLVIEETGVPEWSSTQTVIFVVVAIACTTPAMYRMLQKASREIARSRELSQVLQRREEEYRTLVEHIPVGIYRTDPDGRILAANRALAELLGYDSPEELMAEGMASAFYSESEVRRKWQRTVERDGTLPDWELPLVRRDGVQIWVRDTAHAVRAADGSVRCYEGALEDVTDRRRAEEALRESEERYRRLVETSPLGIAVHCDGAVVYANNATACLLGAEGVDEVVGMSLRSLLHADDSLLAERINTVDDEGHPEPPSPHEERLVRLDGKTIDVEVITIPTSYRGRPAVQVVLHDVSDYKQAQAAARSRSDELEKLFGLTSAINAGQSVTEILDGLFESFRGLLPYDRIEYADVEENGRVLRTRWVRADYEDLVLEEGHVYRRSDPARASQMRPRIDNDLVAYAESKGPGNPTRLLVAEGLHSSLSCPLVLRGTVVGYLFFASRSPDAYSSEHAALILRVAYQIAVALEQSRLRDELITRNESLETLNQSRTRFLANVSHELRTPLTAVVGLAAEMRDRLHHITDDEVGDFAHLIATSSSEVAGIVEDLLAIARAEQDQLTVIPEHIDLHDIARTAVDTWNPKESTSIEVRGDRCKAWADPLRVRQIVRNLCSNAGHHGGDTIRIQVLATRSEAVLIVADNGPGIPEPERDAIFEAYVAAGTDRTRSSVGLGLTVSRHLARAMGGDLTYKYEDGQSQFQLVLPKVGADHQPLPG